MSKLIKALEHQLPDLLKAWEIALRSGYSVVQIVEATSQMTRTKRPIDLDAENSAVEIMESVAYDSPEPVAGQFKQVVEEVEAGSSIFEALDNMLERIPSEDLGLVIATMKAQREVGGNLADILQVIGLVIRQRKRE